LPSASARDKIAELSDNLAEWVAEFIFMLTREDQTIADAREVYESVAATGVRHVGCKDVGLPQDELAALMADIRSGGHTSYLEVVSETEEATLRSAEVAAEIRPDCLIGGTLIEPVQEVIEGTGMRFFPYVGQVVGHPCLLRGTIAEIAEDARRAEALGVDGINLLAYRYDGDVGALVEAVVDAVSVPVIAAGSVDSTERIRALADRGVWAFTIGTAALEGVIVPGAPLVEQLRYVLDAATGVKA
jgi:NAD(P)H-dependent flavin oxidoreductase YrpB (nitropropane dioxygenase family)